MSGAFFLATLCAIVAVIVWSIMNDRVGPFEKTKGIFAMRDEGIADHLGKKEDSPDNNPNNLDKNPPNRLSRKSRFK